MRLVSIYKRSNAAKILYDLLSEREPRQNVNHRRIPSFETHCAFLRSKPYQAWYLIEARGVPIGSVYLSKHDEIGIFIFKAHQDKGWGRLAIAALKRLHPRQRYLANIALSNAKSLAFFTTQGFNLLSVTLEYREEKSCSTALQESGFRDVRPTERHLRLADRRTRQDRDAAIGS